jgi:hypothetical protein
MQHHFKNLKSVLIEELNKAQWSIYAAVAWYNDQIKFLSPRPYLVLF